MTFEACAKREWRIKLKEKRASLSNEQRQLATSKAVQQLAFFLKRMKGCCALYTSIRDEISPSAITDYCAHIHWALPVIDHDNMVMSAWQPGDALINNRFGIAEPKHSQRVIPDIIIMPLLGFDSYGTRLGYGGGYYDRYCQDIAPNALRIGLAFAVQQCHQLPREAHDMPLHATITEYGIMRHNPVLS